MYGNVRFKLETRLRSVVRFTARLIYPRERTTVPTDKEAGWDPGLVSVTV